MAEIHRAEIINLRPTAPLHMNLRPSLGHGNRSDEQFDITVCLSSGCNQFDFVEQ
jgi:hypothetical protein